MHLTSNSTYLAPRSDIKDVVAYTATRPSLGRPYKYNNKRLQHRVENEWTDTQSKRTTAGTKKQVSTKEKSLPPDAVAEVSDVDDAFNSDKEGDGNGAQAFESEDSVSCMLFCSYNV